MNASVFFFYLLSALILFFGVLTVTTRKIFRAAVYLLLTLMTVAGLYFYMHYEFIAAVQIIVYVGGIVVLILFSLFLTHHAGSKIEVPSVLRTIAVGLCSLIGFVLCFNLIKGYIFTPTNSIAIEPSVNEIGRQMLNTTQYGYILPFELVSILLLAAMIGAIVVAMKTKEKV